MFMKQIRLFLVAGIALLLASCGNNGDNKEQPEQKTETKEPPREQYLEQIKRLEAEMHKSTDINKDTAILAIKAYSDYATFFPDDTIAPYYLFKAGEIATATKLYQQALIYYETITSKYPDFKYAQESLYLQGFLLDNLLNDDDKAKTVYEQVITKYPTSKYAKDAKDAINNLGKTDEQLIQEFKKKNGEK
jgi:TolA-binding protein